MSKQLSLAVTPSVKLRKSQASLYEFIVRKHEAGKTINLNEIVEQYSKYGARNLMGGKPAGYYYNWEEQRQILAPLKEYELKSWAIQWFVRNLGVFVVKGLLTAIPTMNLKDIEVEEDTLNTEVKESNE